MPAELAAIALAPFAVGICADKSLGVIKSPVYISRQLLQAIFFKWVEIQLVGLDALNSTSREPSAGSRLKEEISYVKLVTVLAVHHGRVEWDDLTVRIPRQLNCHLIHSFHSVRTSQGSRRSEFAIRSQ